MSDAITLAFCKSCGQSTLTGEKHDCPGVVADAAHPKDWGKAEHAPIGLDSTRCGLCHRPWVADLHPGGDAREHHCPSRSLDEAPRLFGLLKIGQKCPRCDGVVRADSLPADVIPAGTSIADAAKLGHTMSSPHDYVEAEGQDDITVEARVCSWCNEPAGHPRHAHAEATAGDPEPVTLDKETAIVAKALTLQLLSVAGDLAVSLDMPESKLDEMKAEDRRSSMLAYNKFADADKRLERIGNLLALVEVCERIADKAAVRSELK